MTKMFNSAALRHPLVFAELNFNYMKQDIFTTECTARNIIVKYNYDRSYSGLLWGLIQNR